MIRLILARILIATIVMLGVVSLTFALLHLVPGDPVEVMLGESAAPADRDALRSELGLDRPLLEQWLGFHRELLKLDLGTSLHSRQDISDLIIERLPWTAALAIASLAVALSIAVPLGIAAALHAGRSLDTGSSVIALLGVSIPNFLLGPLLIIVFALNLGWLPVSGNEHAHSIILPAVTLGTSLAAILTRMIRAALLEVLREEFITAARARGLNRIQVVLYHALPNAALPVLTIVGMQLGALLGGAVITEAIFNWPGMGMLTVEAIQRRDYPVVQAAVLVISLSYVLINMTTDILYAWVDPRVEIS